MQSMKMSEPVLTREPPRGIRGNIEALQEKISALYKMAHEIHGFIVGYRNEDEVPKVSPDCLAAEIELMTMEVNRTGDILADVITALEG